MSRKKVFWCRYEKIYFMVECDLPVFAVKSDSMEKSGLQPSGKLGDL